MKQITAKEFRELGLIQEINRLFLHPMGLALEIKIDEYGNEEFGGVWDYRDDPEGMIFDEKTINTQEAQDKAIKVEILFESKKEARIKSFGWHIQPIGKK